MTAGIYALENGFDVSIYEKHSLPGGECTGWQRDGAFIDGCAHWIVGTNPKSELFPLWKHIGAFDENSKIYDTEYFTNVEVGNEMVTFYADKEKLKQELLRISPSDTKQIKKLLKGIDAYSHVHIPVDKPIDMMNIFELTRFGIKSLPMAFAYLKYKKISISSFSSKFKSPLLQEAFGHILSGDYNMHSLLYVMQTLAKKDAGVVEGGSLRLALRIKDRFEKLGGKIHFNEAVTKVNIDGNKAVSILTSKENKAEGDYFVLSADAHHSLYDLLGNQYKLPFLNNRFENLAKNPLSQCVLCAYKVNKDISDYPKMLGFKVPPFKVANSEMDYITLRNHSFDRTLNKDGKTTITVLLELKNDAYDYFKNLSKEDYKKDKETIGLTILAYIKGHYKLNDKEISLLDVTTPLTYERYTNAFHGSYMSFITTNASGKLMTTGEIKGLDNVILTGQWLMPPGGLPIALFTGKHAAMRIAKKEGKKFICLEAKEQWTC